MHLSKFPKVFFKLQNIFAKMPNVLYKFQNVFVQIAKWICPDFKMYLSKSAVRWGAKQSVTFRFRNFSIFLDGIGFGIEKVWYRIRYRKSLVSDSVSKKVSDSVSKKIGIRKSFGYGFVQIWGNFG